MLSADFIPIAIGILVAKFLSLTLDLIRVLEQVASEAEHVLFWKLTISVEAHDLTTF